MIAEHFLRFQKARSAALRDQQRSGPVLKGKVAMVIGGNQGIGRAIALRLAEDGADVAIIYRKDQREAEQVVGKLSNGTAELSRFERTSPSFRASSLQRARQLIDWVRPISWSTMLDWKRKLPFAKSLLRTMTRSRTYHWTIPMQNTARKFRSGLIRRWIP